MAGALFHHADSLLFLCVLQPITSPYHCVPPAMLQLPEADFVNTRTSLREVLAMRRKYLEWSHQEFYHTTAKWLDADHEEVDLDISKDQFLLRLGSTGELNLTEQGDLASEGGECCVCVPVRVGSVVCVCVPVRVGECCVCVCASEGGEGCVCASEGWGVLCVCQ